MLREINGGKENKRAAVRCRDEKRTGLWIALENSPWPPTVAFGGIMLIKCSELIERKSWFIGPDVSRVWKKNTLESLQVPTRGWEGRAAGHTQCPHRTDLLFCLSSFARSSLLLLLAIPCFRALAFVFLFASFCRGSHLWEVQHGL